jgi:hypothetical protein
VRVVPKSGLVFDAGLASPKLVTGLCSDKHIGHARQRRRDRNLYVSDEKNSNAYLVFCRKARAIEERNARPDGLLSA